SRCNRDKSFAELFPTAGWFLFLLRHDPELFLLIINERIGRHALHQEDVAADCRSCTNHGLATKNGRTRINCHVVFYGRMTFAAFLDFAALIFPKTTRDHSDGVIRFHSRTDHRCPPNEAARPMIGQTARTASGPRMTVGPSA